MNTQRIPRLWLMWVLSAVSLVGVLLVYDTLPEMMPTHYNFKWEVDRTAHKSLMFAEALLPFLFLAMMEYMPRRKRYAEMRKNHEKAYRMMEIVTAFMLLMLVWIPILGVRISEFKVETALSVLLGVCFAVLGNYMPTIRPNKYFGVKGFWIRKHESVWRKSQKAGGYLLVGFGISMILAGLTRSSVLYAAAAAVMVLGLLLVFAWTIVWYQRAEKKE